VPERSEHQHVSRPTGRHGLGPHVVGQRVVVRRLLRGEQGPSGGPAMTDVLGVCTSWGDGVCVVESADGPVDIAVADIVSGKPVPPRPSVRHRASALEVERHAFVLWPAMTTESLGEWVLRVAPPQDGRRLRRANTVLAMGSPGMPLERAAAQVVGFYAGHGRPPVAQVETGSGAEAGLLALGWSPLGAEARCRLASLARARRTCHRLVEGPRAAPAGRDVPVSTRVTPDGPRVEVALVSPGGHPLARGRAAVDGDWLGVHGLWVDPDHRRQGLALRVMAELLEWGLEQGGTTAWLHVEAGNPAADALHESLGFATHHAYRYLAAPAAPEETT
jgi:GNAT superfamily N-acetyltransferase